MKSHCPICGSLPMKIKYSNPKQKYKYIIYTCYNKHEWSDDNPSSGEKPK